jgi:hypothetical protein
MSLEGLRAWIGEVERKLAKRTRVFLVLAVIAIGIGGAAIYLAIDARESSVSESDVQTLQQQLEARIDELSAATSSPQTEPEAEPTPGKESQPEAGTKGAGGTPEGATGGSASAAKLQELLQRSKEKAAEGK